MYSSYYVPKDGRQSTVLTDHEALQRDAATHKSIQSDESILRPIDLETIMSNNKAVKFWYLHRPKTMEYVHKNATKIQSVGRAFAVRQLKKKHGTEYVVALAKADAQKKEAERIAELSEAERLAKASEDAEYDARVEESRRLRREQEERERLEEEALRARLAAEQREKDAAMAAQREEEERVRQEEAEKAALAAAALAVEEEARRVAAAEEAARLEELRIAEEAEAARLEEIRLAEEEEAARIAAELAAQEELRRAAEEEAARVAAEQEALRLELERQEQERIAAEEEAARIEWEEKERVRAAAEAARQQAMEEKERARLAALEAEKMERYEQSLSKDVPVIVRHHGPGRVVSYDKDEECYTVKMEQAMGGLRITVKATDVNLDDDRILSPRTKVDTPFGTGEVVGLDPHVGCYAINTEVNATDGDQFLAFIQIADVHVHEEEMEERAIVENASIPIPEEIGLVSARIVDSRVVNKTGKKFIQYKLEIRTTNYGTVHCWKRYSTFRSLCERLTKEAGYSKKEIPELPKRHIAGNFSQKTIGERAEKLNLFLNAAVQAEHLQWGVRVDDQIAVYKRRVKRQGDPASSRGRKEPTSSRGIFSSRRR